MSLPRSWIDFADFLETGANVQQRPAGEHGDVLAPAEAAALFEELEERLRRGDLSALWAGITTMCRYNVPAPYWLADALLQADKLLHTTTQSAHEVLGLNTLLPLQATRGPLARRRLRLALQLWFEVQRQRRKSPGMSTARAVAAARKTLKFPYEQRASVTMFTEQDARQRKFEAPYKQNKAVKCVHR